MRREAGYGNCPSERCRRTKALRMERTKVRKHEEEGWTGIGEMISQEGDKGRSPR